MKTSKAMGIELSDNEIKAINDAKLVIRNILEECENEFPVNDYVLNIEDGWVVLDEHELDILSRCLEGLSGIKTMVAMEVDNGKVKQKTETTRK